MTLLRDGAPLSRFSSDTRSLAGALAWSTRSDVVLDGGVARRQVAAHDESRPVWLGCYVRWWALVFGT